LIPFCQNSPLFDIHMEKYNFLTAINIDDSRKQQACWKEPFLAVLEYILIPKYINFYGKADHYGDQQ